METFNIQRFGNVCTRLVMLRKREYFNIFLAVVLFVGLFCVFTCNPFSGDAIEPLQYKYLFLQLGITIFLLVNTNYAIWCKHYSRPENKAATYRRTGIASHQFRKVHGTRISIYGSYTHNHCSRHNGSRRVTDAYKHALAQRNLCIVLSFLIQCG